MEETMVEVPLSTLESTFTVVPSIASITFYTGNTCELKLKQKTSQVVEANPFLRARLRCIGHGKVAAAYRDGDYGIFDEVGPEQAPGIWNDTNYSTLVQQCSPYVVSTGEGAVADGSPLFRVVVLKLPVPEEGPIESRFAVVVSMSHILGDGWTFYNLLNQLGAQASVVSLDRSVVDSSVATEAALGADEAALLGSDAVGASFRKNAAAPGCFSHLFWVDQAAVSHRKAQQLELNQLGGCIAGFVSTNDILTAAFLSASKSDLGCLAVNLRGRIPGVPERGAGNYEACLPLLPSDFDAAAIRRAVQGPERFCRLSAGGTVDVSESGTSDASSKTLNKEPLPPGEVLAKGKLSVVSNLAGFYNAGGLELHEAVFAGHLVLRPISAVAWQDSAFIFRSGDRLGMICAGRGVCRDKGLLFESALGEFLERC